MRNKPRGHTNMTVNDNGDERTRMVSNTRSSNVIDEECEAAARGNKFFGVPGLRSPIGFIYPLAENANQLWPWSWAGPCAAFVGVTVIARRSWDRFEVARRMAGDTFRCLRGRRVWAKRRGLQAMILSPPPETPRQRLAISGP